ncbi:MAG: hypothetical protein ABGY72_13370 [bacterium]
MAGILVGWVSAKLVDRAVNSGWMAESYEGPAVLGVAVLSFAGAEIIGGNGFIAAFVAGLIFGNTVRERCKFLFEFAEAEGELMVFVTFLIFWCRDATRGIRSHHWCRHRVRGGQPDRRTVLGVK